MRAGLEGSRSSSIPSVRLASLPRGAAESLVVTLAAACLYMALQGDLPFHDAQRFTNQVAGGLFVWDVAHVLLQPLALLMDRCLGLGSVATLKTLSSLAAASASGLFYLLLVRQNLPRWQCALGTVLLVMSCSVITLAPSAHPKLGAFPFIMGAFLCLAEMEWHGAPKPASLAACGCLLAIACGLLASVVTTVPFAGLAVLAMARRGGASWPRAAAGALILCGTWCMAFLAILLPGYVLLTGQSLSLAGITGSVAGKVALRGPPTPLSVDLARIWFGSVNNLMALPRLGATVNAWMRGQIPSLWPYGDLLPLLACWALASLLLAWIQIRAASAVIGGKCLAAAAFLCGAQAWAFWYGMNDPEHWFMLTAPTIALFLLASPPRVIRSVLPAWALTAAVLNLFLSAIPTATYPLAANEAKLAALVGGQDLLVQFAAYPGRPYAAYLQTPGVPRLEVDSRIYQDGAAVALHSMDAELTATLRRGGRVIVADMLEERDWDAPWMTLLSFGVTKPGVRSFLLHDRAARRLPDIGGIEFWELRIS